MDRKPRSVQLKGLVVRPVQAAEALRVLRATSHLEGSLLRIKPPFTDPFPLNLTGSIRSVGRLATRVAPPHSAYSSLTVTECPCDTDDG